MADTRPVGNFDDELLSAYLDGELDEAQHAQVEQRLSNDPSAQQLLSELQSLSETLRSLPREKIGEELCEAALRQAERTMLLGEGELSKDQSPGSFFSFSQERRLASKRRWVWAAMAVAVALLLMIYQPIAIQEEQPLAKVKAKPQAGDASESGELYAEAVLDLAESELAESDLVESEDELPEALFLVHVTLAEMQGGQKRFDQLLARNGFDLEAQPVGKKANRRRSASALSSSPASGLAEAVLIEASPSQIERLLVACNADSENWKSLSFEAKEEARFPTPQWRGLERKGAMADKPRLPAEATAGVAMQTPESAASRGKATHLNADWHRYRFREEKVKKETPEEEDRKSPPKAKTSATIRVLFVLHPPEPSGEVIGK